MPIPSSISPEFRLSIDKIWKIRVHFLAVLLLIQGRSSSHEEIFSECFFFTAFDFAIL